MRINPKRRRRIIKVHYLRQQGHAQRKIAEKLDISHATVRADLQLAETHWSELAAAAADDLLLQSLQLLQIRLSIAISQDGLSKLANSLSPAEFLRARDAQETQFNALAREIRRTAHDIHQRAAQRPDQPELFQDLPETIQERAETSTESFTTIHSEHTIPSPEQEISPETAPTKTFHQKPSRRPSPCSPPSRNPIQPPSTQSSAKPSSSSHTSKVGPTNKSSNSSNNSPVPTSKTQTSPNPSTPMLPANPHAPPGDLCAIPYSVIPAKAGIHPAI